MRTGSQKSYWFDGEMQGNFSLSKRDSFDPNKYYLGVRIQQGVPVLDRDWNELEDIRRYQEMCLRRYYLGNGAPGDGFKVTDAGSTSVVSISKGRFLVDGIEVENNDDPLSHTLTSTPSSNPCYVYLEVKIQEVRSTIQGGTDPDLNNDEDAKVETCIRHKPVWVVKDTMNATDYETEPTDHPATHRCLLATITLNGSTLEIEDGRPKLNLLETGDLGYQKLDGLEIGNGAFLVWDPDNKTLQVKFLDTTGTDPALTGPYFDLSPDRALLPGPVRIGDTTWPPATPQTENLYVAGEGGATIEGGLTANGDPSATPTPILGLTVNDGATIEGGLTANGDPSVAPPILGLTVNDGATISGGLTIDGGELALANGATVSGLSSGSGTFTEGLTVSNSTVGGTGLTVNNGSVINGGLTVNNAAGIGLTVNNGLTVSTGDLAVSSVIQANGGLFLPPTILSIVSGGPASFEAMFKENDVSGVENGGEFAWLAINTSYSSGSPPTVTPFHRMSLGFKPDGATNFGEVWYIKSDGSYPASTSDQMYKTNVATLTDVLQKLDQIRGVSFEWNDLYKASHYGAPETRQIGMIAQEIQAVFPELVEEVTLHDRTFLGLDYQRFTAVLVQALKELKAINEALSDRVKALEGTTKTKAKKVTNNERPA